MEETRSLVVPEAREEAWGAVGGSVVRKSLIALEERG